MRFFKSIRGRKAKVRKFRAEPLAAAVQGKILEQYKIDQALVLIVNQGGKGLYLVKEPELRPKEQETYSRLMENLWYGLRPVGVAKVGDKMKYVEGFVWDAAQNLGIMDEVQAGIQTYRYFIGKDGFGYGKLHIPVMDAQIEDVSITGFGTPVTVFHRKYPEFGWLETNIVFRSEDELRGFAQRLAQLGGKSITTAFPYVDATTPEGHRISISLGGEVSFPGTSIDIRKFTPAPFSLLQLIKMGTLSPLIAGYLWLLQEHRAFTMIVGPPGSGKTTFLDCLLSLIPLNKKIGTAEDTLELSIPHQNWVRLRTRTGYSFTESRYDVGLFDLVTQLVRQRPDYVAVGEIRGKEAQALIHAASIGLGCLSTIHTDSPESALVRLRTDPMNVSEGGLMLIWCLVTMTYMRLPNDQFGRRVVDISEVVPGAEAELQTLLRWDARDDSFSPDRARDLVGRSVRMRAIQSLTRMSRRDLIRELEARSDYLQEKVEEGRLSFSEFVDAVARYYAKR